MLDKYKEILRKQLMLHEGFAARPYKDTLGYLSIGFGRNLTNNGITKEEALYLMNNDIAGCEDDLEHLLPFYKDIDNARKVVLLNMCFNMGIVKLMGFKKMMTAINAKDYKKASEEMLVSLWAKQVGNRALYLATCMETGALGGYE